MYIERKSESEICIESDRVRVRDVYKVSERVRYI